MIVIDVGCARYGADYSIERLIAEFHPDELYGFDPNPVVLDDCLEIRTDENGRTTKIYTARVAAWTYDGEIGYREDGLNSWITDREGTPQVPCVDLARVVDELTVVAQSHEDKRVVLKLDAEGSEYDLLSHLMIQGADELLDLVIVEWHPKTVPNAEDRRHVIEREIACEIREWPW